MPHAPRTTAAVARTATDDTAHAPIAPVVELRPRARRTPAHTRPAPAVALASVTTLHTPAPAVADDTDDDPLTGRDASPPQGTVRIQLTDGRILWATMIRDYRPTFTEEDYAALARCRDELRAHAAHHRATEATTATEPAQAA